MLLCFGFLIQEKAFTQTPCPTIGALTNPGEVCLGDNFNLTASGLANMAMADNGDNDYGIAFLHIVGAAIPANLYDGSIFPFGPVGFGNLDNGNTEATINGVGGLGQIPTAGVYTVCAILTPDPTDLNCRPSVCQTYTIYDSPEITCPANVNLPNDCNYNLPTAATTYNVSTDVIPDPTLPSVVGICGTNPTLSSSDVIVDVGCTRTVTRTYTYTDDNGTDFCEQEFIFPNGFNLLSINCPNDIVINLDPGLCETIVNWDPNQFTTSSGCGLVTVTPDPVNVSGATYNKNDSPYTVTYQAEDECGNMTSCDFTITVLDFPNPISTIACNMGTQITLDPDCEAIIGADIALEGGPYSCYDDYIVELFYDENMTQPVPTSPMVTGADLGIIYTMVTNPDGLSCWGFITIEDKTDPLIQCENLNLLCTDVIPESPGSVIPTDACGGDLDLDFTDNTIQDLGVCQIKIIERTWLATDESGNTADCVQTITISPIDPTMVVFPQNFDGLNGNPDPLDCAIFDTDPSNTGVPTINGLPLYDVNTGQPNSTCGLTASIYSEETLNDCDNGNGGLDGSYKLLRTWRLFDWCGNIDPLLHIQTIKIADHNAPYFTDCPTGIQSISVDNYSCSATLTLPVLNAVDDCSSDITVTVYVNGILHTTSDATLLPGTNTVTYIAEDACGNSDGDLNTPGTSVCTIEYLVEDLVAPNVSCDGLTIVPINGVNPVLINASTFNDTSEDICGEVTFLARRMDDFDCAGNANAFAEQVPFYCCDVNDPNPIMVILQVTDESGNSATCMVQVDVQDKLDPIIEAPTGFSLDCTNTDPTNSDFFLSTNSADGPAAYDGNGDFAGYYTGVTDDNCEVVRVDFTLSGGVNTCGVGSYEYCFIATDASGRTSQEDCTNITIVNNDAFVEGDIVWPLNYNATSCGTGLDPEDLVFPFSEPTNLNNTCSWIAAGHEDLEANIQAPGCLYIIRTWTVIDECTFDPTDPDFLPGTQTGEDGIIPGHYTHVQQITVTNSDDPVLTGSCTDQSFCNTGTSCTNGVTNGLQMTAADDCTATNDLVITYEIDLDSDGSYAAAVTGSDADDIYPLGIHTIRWVVADGCGNEDICEYQFTIADCTRPTPIAHNGLAVDLNPDGTIVVNASFFDNNSFDNCNDASNSNNNGNGICEMRIFSPSLGMGQDLNSPPSFDFVEFDCNHVNPLGVSVDFWVKDCADNWKYVSTYIVIEDNNTPPACPTSSVMIYGQIGNESGESIEDVSVELMSDQMSTPEILMTGDDGIFEFPVFQNGETFTLTPEKDINPLNGISTYDLVLLSQHILGIEYLNSPYKIIAADINHSGSISSFDMVELRKLILFIDTEFQNNDSWRFVEANFEFPDLTNPFSTPFPELGTFDDVTSAEQVNFVGVKVGDLNDSAIPNQLLGSSSRNTVGDFVFRLEDQTLNKNGLYTVDFKAKDFKDISAFQFTLEYDLGQLDFVNIIPGDLTQLTPDNFGLSLLSKGVITSSWNTLNNIEVADETILFSIQFNAKENGQLSSAINVSSRYTNTEAYNSKGELLNLDLAFETTAGTLSVGNKFQLFQNQPNPFRGETIIGFNLPKSSHATVTIYDATGKSLRVITKEFTKGYNEVAINKSDLAGSGVLYYQLDTDHDSATRKMILID